MKVRKGEIAAVLLLAAALAVWALWPKQPGKRVTVTVDGTGQLCPCRRHGDYDSGLWRLFPAAGHSEWKGSCGGFHLPGSYLPEAQCGLQSGSADHLSSGTDRSDGHR